MSNTITYGLKRLSGIAEGYVVDGAALIKFKLSALVVFSAVLAYLIVAKAGGYIDWMQVLILGLGGFCTTGASNVLNQILEVDYDREMERTKGRPLAAGRRSPSEALLLAGILAIVGLLSLASFNWMTGFLGALAMILYAFVYTPLKRYSPLAVMIGAIPGALPMAIGCTAYEGELSLFAFLLFAIQFLWQFPHFWAIGVLSFDDYKKAGFRMVPEENNKPHGSVGSQAVYMSCFLIPASMMIYVMGWTGIWGGAIIMLAALLMTYRSWQFKRGMDHKSARALLFSSLYYLPVMLIALFLF